MKELITIELVTKNGMKIIQEFQGIQLYEVAEKYYGKEDGLTPIFARVDDRGWDLLHHLNRSCRVEFMDMSTRLGRMTYQRTIYFLFKVALHEIAPHLSCALRFPLNDGILIELQGERKKDGSLAWEIEKRMRELIASGVRFQRRILRREEILGPDRPELITDYLLDLVANCDVQEIFEYEYEGFRELFFDPLMESPGSLDVFEIVPYHGNIIIRVPNFGNPTGLREYRDDILLYKSFEKTSAWRQNVEVDYIGDLNRKVNSGAWRDLILVCEAYHEKKIALIADEFMASGKRIILIAGPSASGKTTFAQRLCIQLRVNGFRPLYMGTDDYFLERNEMARDENGKLDFENISAVDVDLFNKHLNMLLNGEEVDIPVFDFISGSKRYGTRITRAQADQPIVIEGIHALNPELTSKIDKDVKFSIYISPLTVLNIDEDNRIPMTDLRLLRRMARDIRSRDRSAALTLKQWPDVRRGEEKNIFPYIGQSDTLFNSTLTYELAVLKPLVLPSLQAISKKEDVYLEAERLIRVLRCVRSVEDTSMIMSNSIIREFIGGGMWVQ
ncbi:MAG: nucleoside kinase [Firmicutes bacterium]|nr:nucleoside kinase [Bacillota bacterium]